MAYYTNSIAYYYAFILAPVAASCGPTLQAAARRYSHTHIAIALTLLGACLWVVENREVLDRQRQMVANVQHIFPEPVRYFDQSYAMGAWPKGNNYMTQWGMSGYQQAALPAYRHAMQSDVIPLVLANSVDLQKLLADGKRGLLVPADDAALRSNYVPYSWPIWIAGKNVVAGQATAREEFLVPGIYRPEGGDIMFNGVRYREGAAIRIARGDHTIANPGASPIRLIWGEDTSMPPVPLERAPVHVDF